jgi:hypothetical protein
MKKIFENAVWWSGVVMVGLILGISLQFVRAWTEPTTAPPDGNVGAPINTGPIEQLRQGALGIVGLLKLYGGLQVPSGVISGTPQKDYVLTAKENPPGSGIYDGTVAWAPSTGGTTDGYTVSGFCQEVSDAGGCYFCKEGQIITEGPCAGRSDPYHSLVASASPAAYCGNDGRCKCSLGTLFLTRDDTGWPTNPYMGNWKPLFEYVCHIPVSH